MSSSSALKLLQTNDGSQTVFNEQTGSTYHSRHGAVTESQHVFIEKGLRSAVSFASTRLSVLEMGFGTGLNALLTEKELRGSNITTDYHALELHPLPEVMWRAYQLPEELNAERAIFDRMHETDWNTMNTVRQGFNLIKHHLSLLDFQPSIKFHLVYFDAFEPETQPELWTAEVFERLYSCMEYQGILTTYCCKGYVRRNMIAAGFEVRKVPGPPGKREMIVATKPLQAV